MPSWGDLVRESDGISDPIAGGKWLCEKQKEWLQKLSQKRSGRNVIFYVSAFLQKPQAPGIFLQISHEDINGFMSTMVGMDWTKQLTLVLHTPGGITNSAETIVEYLVQKFSDIEVIIPTFAMSAGTMISLSANRIIMGRQSQLGPIDPQLFFGGRTVSARAIVDQFAEAKKDILRNRDAAAAWIPALQTLGPALLTEARNALQYGEQMVERWLKSRMFRNNPRKARKVAKYFNRAEMHKSHGRRIARDEARSQGLLIDDLEADQEFQDIVLTNYHIATLIFEKTPAAKFIAI